MIYLLTVTLTLCQIANAGRILAVFPYHGYSHQIMFKGVVETMLEYGHSVTVISTRTIQELHKNVNHIVLPVFETGWTEIFNFNDKVGQSPMMERLDLELLMHGYKVKFYETPEVQNFIGNTREKFDAIIYEPFFAQEDLSFLGHRFKAPLVALSTSIETTIQDYYSGCWRNPAVFPEYDIYAPNGMNLKQRLINTVGWVGHVLEHKLYHLPKRQSYVTQYVKYEGSDKMPPLSDLLSDIALHLVNSHPTVSQMKPCLSNVILTPGLHINPKPNNLPTDVKAIMDKANEGVILISLGSLVPVSKLPTEKIDAFRKALSQVSHTVLWKSDTDLPDMPKNIKILKWLPQQDALSHPNCRLLITHGGMQSKQEAVFFGVPLLTIPLFGDQFTNAAHGEKLGISVTVNYHEISSKTLYNAIKTVISDNRYTERIGNLSLPFKRDVSDSKRRIAYWMEMLMDSQGLDYLKERHTLYWFEYCLLDGIFLTTLFSVLLLFALYKLAALFGSLRFSREIESMKLNEKKKKL